MQLIEVIGGITPSPAHWKPPRTSLLIASMYSWSSLAGGVIETQVALTTELLRQAKVQANRLGVPDVQITVGLRGRVMILACLPESRSAWTIGRRKLLAAGVSGLLMVSLTISEYAA